ncbi:somatotropin-like isoform X1 [Hemitrygon akajei]|uniref:somatotropin-like isoform X1 n=1 Tax=Hemitrygon akajei TaxID=2704970 RepID=UPI003BF9B58E
MVEDCELVTFVVFWCMLCFMHSDINRMASGNNQVLSLCSIALTLMLVSMQCPRDLEAYPLLPLSDMFAKAVHRAQHLHLVAAETCKDFERKYIPEEQRHSHKSSPSAFCQSETIPAPTGKEDAQQRSEKELLLYSLLLIQSWLNPIQNSRAFRTSDRVYDKLRDLEEGIYAVMKALEDGDSSQGFGWLKFSYDRFSGDLSEEALMKNYGLLACFKKDMHKVETYLKVMNCKRFAESNCTV